MKLKRRTEAIGQLDDVKVYWDAGKTPYWDPADDSVHLPSIPDHEITDEDVMFIRGYIDHENRHHLYSKNMTKDRTEALNKIKGLHGLVNCLEDARIEAIYRKAGEKFNLIRLRNKLCVKASGIEYKNPYAHAVTAFLYRHHGIDFELPDKSEKAYSELSGIFKDVLEAQSINEVHDYALMIFDKIKDSIEDEVTNKNKKDDHKKDEEDQDKLGDSESGTNKDETEKREIDNKDLEGETEEQEVENEEGEKSGPGESEDESEDEDSEGSGSSKSEDESEDEADSAEGSGNKEDFEDPRTPEEIAKEIEDAINKAEEEIEKELEGNDFADEMKKKIEELAGDSDTNYKYISYTKGDVFNRYKFDPNFHPADDISKMLDLNAKMITRQMIKVLRSKTDTYRKYGEKKGKRIAKSKLAGFSSGMNNAPFYKEENVEQISAKVSILVDMSGSMGATVKDAAAFATILASSLNALKIDFEILGFYNVSALNCHIWNVEHSKDAINCHSPWPKIYEVFHEFGTPYKEKKFINIANQITQGYFSRNKRFEQYGDHNFAGKIKNNDDGESVYEASRRLLKYSNPEDKKILFVLSDGQPMAENIKPGNLKTRVTGNAREHLRVVLNKIRKETDIDIFAFGFSGATAVASYYGKENSIYISEISEEFKKRFIQEMKEKLVGSLK